MEKKKYKLISDEADYEDLEYTVAEIIDYINENHSEEWTPYEAHDWIEGLLEWTEYMPVFDVGDVLYFAASNASLVVREEVQVQTLQEIIKTSAGDVFAREVNTAPVILFAELPVEDCKLMKSYNILLQEIAKTCYTIPPELMERLGRPTSSATQIAIEVHSATTRIDELLTKALSKVE